ncbi:hypothetical protein XENOCAPTIV_024474, partial [Xenoophorus captivus]
AQQPLALFQRDQGNPCEAEPDSTTWPPISLFELERVLKQPYEGDALRGPYITLFPVHLET